MFDIYNTPNSLHLGCCLEIMKSIKDKSIHFIFADLPYGMTSCKWDSTIPLDLLWVEYNRILVDAGTIALTSIQPFTTHLINSNFEMFKYDWVWQKNKPTGFVFSKSQPLRDFESVLIFQKQNYFEGSHAEMRQYFKKVLDFIGLSISQINKIMGNRYAEHCFYIKSKQFNLPDESTYKKLSEVFKLVEMPDYKSFDELKKFDKIYNPQGVIKKAKPQTKKKNKTDKDWVYETTSLTGKEYQVEYENYPRTVLKFDCETGLHPTQKPVALVEYFIKTYTHKDFVVLDNCAGSGTTAIACINTNRKYICIEKDETHYNTAKHRIETHKNQPSKQVLLF